MKYQYKTQNVCPSTIEFDMDDNIVRNVVFSGGGCDGNLKAVPILVDGCSADYITSKLLGNICGNKSTSCVDQLAHDVLEACQKKHEKQATAII